MPNLSHQCDRLQPSEALFNSLPLLLTDFVSLVPGGSPIDCATPAPLRVLRYVRGHLHVSAFAYEVSGVIRLIRTDRDSMSARNLFQHQHCCMTLGGASGREDFRRDDESVAVLCQQVPVVAELGFLPAAFARQKSVWISGGSMGFVAALLSVEVYRRITRIPLAAYSSGPSAENSSGSPKPRSACRLL